MGACVSGRTKIRSAEIHPQTNPEPQSRIVNEMIQMAGHEGANDFGNKQKIGF